jgi:hypothetical protein
LRVESLEAVYSVKLRVERQLFKVESAADGGETLNSELTTDSKLYTSEQSEALTINYKLSQKIVNRFQ